MKTLVFVTISFFLLSCSSVVPMKLSSSAFTHNGAIPSKYTCDGEDISPPLSWADVPPGTKSFVLIHDDPDAVPVAGFVWDHWILINIPPETKSITENSKAGVEMRNSFQKTTYGGPCPPNNKHRYYFKLYALDTELNLSGKATKADIEKTMEDHILAKAELIGTYDRKKR